MPPYSGQGWGPNSTKTEARTVLYIIGVIILAFGATSLFSVGFEEAPIGITCLGLVFVFLGWMQKFTN